MPSRGTSGAPKFHIRDRHFCLVGRCVVATPQIPVSYVLDHAVPTLAELRWGLAHRWIEPADVIAISLAKMKAGVELDATEEQIALLLSDEVDQVKNLLLVVDEDLPASTAPQAQIWKYLAVKRVVDTNPEFSDQLDAFDYLWCDFDHDEELAHLVRYNPHHPERGSEVGLPAIRKYLEDYLAYTSSMDPRLR